MGCFPPYKILLFQPRLCIPGALGENITGKMMFKQFFKLKPEPKPDSLQVGSRSVPLLFVHHPRARRYLLRLADSFGAICRRPFYFYSWR